MPLRIVAASSWDSVGFAAGATAGAWASGGGVAAGAGAAASGPVRLQPVNSVAAIASAQGSSPILNLVDSGCIFDSPDVFAKGRV
jgi:hypothetical protein